MKNGILGLNLSLIVCCYFAGLVVISGLKIKPPVLVGVLVELITTPLVLIGLGLLIYNLYRIYKEGWIVKSYSFFTVFILTVSMSIVIAATVHNI